MKQDRNRTVNLLYGRVYGLNVLAVRDRSISPWVYSDRHPLDRRTRPCDRLDRLRKPTPRGCPAEKSHVRRRAFARTIPEHQPLLRLILPKASQRAVGMAEGKVRYRPERQLYKKASNHPIINHSQIVLKTIDRLWFPA